MAVTVSNIRPIPLPGIGQVIMKLKFAILRITLFTGCKCDVIIEQTLRVFVLVCAVPKY